MVPRASSTRAGGRERGGKERRLWREPLKGNTAFCGRFQFRDKKGRMDEHGRLGRVDHRDNLVIFSTGRKDGGLAPTVAGRWAGEGWGEGVLGPLLLVVSHSVMSTSLRPRGLQRPRPPCPSPTAGVYPHPCPLSR